MVGMLLLHRLLHVLLVLSRSVSLFLHRGVEVSNDLVSPYGIGIISVNVIDDDDVVSMTGTTSTHMVVGGVPVHVSTPTKLHCDPDDDVAEQPQPQQYLDHLPRCSRSSSMWLLLLVPLHVLRLLHVEEVEPERHAILSVS